MSKNLAKSFLNSRGEFPNFYQILIHPYLSVLKRRFLPHLPDPVLMLLCFWGGEWRHEGKAGSARSVCAGCGMGREGVGDHRAGGELQAGGVTK